MKRFIRFASIFLAVCALASCGGAPAQTDPVTTEPVTEPPVPEIPFVITGNAVFENGNLTAERGGGASFALIEDGCTEKFRLYCEIVIKASGIGGVMLFSDGEANGIYLAADYGDQNISLYRVENNMREQLGRRKCTFEKGERIPIVIEYNEGLLKLYFNENPLDTDPYPKFELNAGIMAAKLKNTGIGFRMGNGIADFYNISITDDVEEYDGKTYTNPVVQGADPDVLFYNGVYYLYQRKGSGNDIFSVSTSTDLVKWKTGGVIYTKQSDKLSGYMSPNVFHYNGKFYLVFAAKHPDVGNHTLFCAVSDTPDGMFKHAGGTPVPIHNDKLVAEIGGHPFIDPDTNKLYLSLVRFGGGNNIWLEEYTIVNDQLVPVAGTLTHCIAPTDSYEIDEFGKIAEGGVIMKHNGYYYMIYASGHYKGHYGEAYAIAENVLGPYKKYENNDILTFTASMDGCGDAVFTTSPDGKELFLVYHIHSAVGTVEPRMTCIDRVKFVPDPNGGPDILTVYGPTNTPQPRPSALP
ncbi:MAG: family 43 glycosylhydrolase [Clostridia bacterium]|nr:family 43 glycosylhydrolase [Clostridia bacterium]MBR0326743.1 family 43 glycosylhydrolase [Clostridia bacterium]